MKKVIIIVGVLFAIGLIGHFMQPDLATTSQAIQPEKTAPTQPTIAKAADTQSQIESLLKKQAGVTDVALTKQAYVNGKELANDDEKYLAEVTLKKDFQGSGAQDWNGLANVVDKIVRVAFAKPEVERLRFKVITDDGKDWAYVDFRQSQFPAGWKDATYLEHFSFADEVSSPYPQGQEALCAFYTKYQSAIPKQGINCQ
jgi:hypothetical protein